MHILDLTFSDGRQCRAIVMEPETDEKDQAGIRSIFHEGYLTGIERRIPPCPEKLPWKRNHGSGEPVWRLHRFELRRRTSGPGNDWHLTWPGGELFSSSKDEVSAAVRNNWVSGS